MRLWLKHILRFRLSLAKYLLEKYHPSIEMLIKVESVVLPE